MHQMAMIRNYILHPHVAGPFWVLPLGTNDETVAVFQGHFSGRRFEEIDAPLIVASLHTRPRLAEIQNGEHGDCGDGHDDSSAACVRRTGRFSPLEVSFANASA